MRRCDLEVIVLDDPPASRRNRSTPSSTIVRKRKTSWGGYRDQDVLDVDVPPQRRTTYQLYRGLACEEVPSPGAPLRRNFEALQINLLSEDESEQVQPTRKKAKTSHPIPQPKRVKNAQNSQQQLRSPRKVKQATETLVRSLASTLPENYFFSRLSPEIRDKIYRHLLVSRKPISVSGLWTELVRSNVPRRGGRARPEQAEEETDTVIDARILSVSKQAAIEGTRILYSENVFLYKMRDPQSLPSRDFNAGITTFKAGGGANSRATRSSRQGAINFAKYGHLFRHMAVELENNRTEEEYELLMACALEALVDTDAYRQNYGLTAIPPWFPSGEISLHTLSITISPIWEYVNPNSNLLATDSGSTVDTVSHGRHLSAVKFFSIGHRVMRALKHINVNFLRVNLHAPETLTDHEDDETEDEGEDFEWTRHLETTIDMRFHPDQVARRPQGLLGSLWENDRLMRVKHIKIGEVAEQSLRELRKRIESACLAPDEGIRRGWWEDHAVAELRREAHRARVTAMFQGHRAVSGDNNSDGNSDDDSNSDSEPGSPGPSLMIILERDPTTGQWRAHRA